MGLFNFGKRKQDIVQKTSHRLFYAAETNTDIVSNDFMQLSKDGKIEALLFNTVVAIRTYGGIKPQNVDSVFDRYIPTNT